MVIGKGVIMNFMGINEEELKTKISAEDFADFEKQTKKILDEALQMECPICRSKLVLGQGTRKYETLSDHVCDPNGDVPERPYFVCPNEKCGLHSNSFWDDYGEFYTRLDFAESRKIFNISIEDAFRNRKPECCKCAMNSSARKSWFEVYYKEESKQYFVGKLGLYFYSQITADKFGNITKRKLKIQWLEKNDVGVCHKVWGSHMFIFMLKQGYRDFRQYKKTNDVYFIKKIKEHCDKDYWTNKGEWWRVSACFINSILYRKYI